MPQATHNVQYEQAPRGKTHPNPLDAGRGLQHALGLACLRRFDQHRHARANHGWWSLR